MGDRYNLYTMLGWTCIDLTRIPLFRLKIVEILSPLIDYKGKYPNFIHSDRGSQYRSYALQEFFR